MHAINDEFFMLDGFGAKAIVVRLKLGPELNRSDAFLMPFTHHLVL
jgi:hypothetical protein